MSDRRSFLKTLFAFPFLSRFGAGRAVDKTLHEVAVKLLPMSVGTSILKKSGVNRRILTPALQLGFAEDSPSDYVTAHGVQTMPENDLGEIKTHEPLLPEVISQDQLDDINPASAEVIDEVLKKFNPDLNPSDLDGVEAALNPLQDHVADQLSDWLFKEVDPPVVVNLVPKPEIENAKTPEDLKKAYGDSPRGYRADTWWKHEGLNPDVLEELPVAACVPSEVEPAYDQDEYLESISYLVDQSFTW